MENKSLNNKNIHKRDKATNGAGEGQQEVMCDEVGTVKRFCYLGGWLNASGWLNADWLNAGLVG